MKMSAIRVIGLVSGSHIVEDIGVSVPYGETVEIPGDTAHRSRDLWRAISQKSLVQVSMAVTQQAQYVDLDRVKRLEAYISELESKLSSAMTKISTLEAAARETSKSPEPNSETESKLDLILKALQTSNGLGLSHQAHIGVSHAFEKYGSKEIVDTSIPQFLPSEIVPKDLDVQLTAQEEASSSTGVSGASNKLRQLRKGKTS